MTSNPSLRYAAGMREQAERLLSGPPSSVIQGRDDWFEILCRNLLTPEVLAELIRAEAQLVEHTGRVNPEVWEFIERFKGYNI